MKKIYFYLSAIFAMLFTTTKAQEKLVTPPVDFYSLSFISINGDTVNFDTLKGKYVLIVNTASKCGFTKQFKDLEELNQKYKDRLVLIGFPSNDFGQQDPGTNQEIQEFCQINYGVSFQMMEKSSVKGENKNPVYVWLTDKSKNGWNEQEPVWNFCKYLIDKEGRLVAFFPSKVNPMSNEIIDKISK